jgi:hypothetical protein
MRCETRTICFLRAAGILHDTISVSSLTAEVRDDIDKSRAENNIAIRARMVHKRYGRPRPLHLVT